MRFVRVVTIVLMTAAAPAMAAEPAPLAKARTRYNAGDFEGAISAAAVARNVAAASDAAALVIARAHLELYRQRVTPEDLAVARETLLAIHVGSLSSRDQLDLYIGIGQTLYLAEVFGPSAEMFETAWTRASVLGTAERRQLLDW